MVRTFLVVEIIIPQIIRVGPVMGGDENKSINQ